MAEFSFKLPDLGEGIVESEIVEWHIQVGDHVNQDQHIADVQTDKAIIESTSPVSGNVLRLGCLAGELLAVGSEMVLFDTTEQKQHQLPATATATATLATVKPSQSQTNSPKTHFGNDHVDGHNNDSRILTSPSVRLRARQNKLNLHHLSGSGPKGRINHQDIDKALSTQQSGSIKTNPHSKASHDTTNDISDSTNNKTGIKRYTLKGTRRLIAKKLLQATQNIPHYSYIEEVDVNQLQLLREQLNQHRTNSQTTLTLLPFIIKALVKSLPYYPHCNAHFNSNTNEISEYSAIHIGIATMTETGLMVPVIQHCENKTLWQYADDITKVSQSAKNKTIQAGQLTGSTITITSLGKLGGIASTPIINAPETCIIGINKIQQKPVVIDDAIAIHAMMNISASFDHRIVDGFDGASLVQAVKRLLENPNELLD